MSHPTLYLCVLFVPPPSYELRHTYNSNNCACRDHLITTRLCWIQVYGGGIVILCPVWLRIQHIKINVAHRVVVRCTIFP